MDPLQDRTVLVTGASSGIGRACARAFAARGARLVLVARRLERLEALREALKAEGAIVRVHALDVRDRPAVEAFERKLTEAGVVPDVLINNAGLARGLDEIWKGDVEDWDEMIDTNVKGLLYVTRQFLRHMVERDRGHVVNIGSSAGRMVYPRGNVYCASKYAVRALTEGIAVDLSGTNVRVSSIDPGMTETEFSEVRFHGEEARASDVYHGITPLSPDDVAEAVLWVVDRPAHVNVHEVLITPTAQRNLYVIDKEGR